MSIQRVALAAHVTLAAAIAALLCLAGSMAWGEDYTLDQLPTQRNARAQVIQQLITTKQRTTDIVAAAQALETKWSLAAIDENGFGLFEGARGTNMLSIANGTPNAVCTLDVFAAGDVGKTIDIAGAGPAGAVLRARIITFLTSKTVTIDRNASAAVAATKTSAAGHAIWGWFPGMSWTTTPLLTGNGAAQLVYPSINLSGATFSGVLGVTNGGTGQTSLDNLPVLGFYNVKALAYGAVGDGVADDLAAINAAIAAVPALTAGTPPIGGGIVFFPPGKYRVSGTINIGKSGVTLVGVSGKDSVLLCESAGQSIVYSDAGNTDVSRGRFSIKNLGIYANSAGAKATGVGLTVTSAFDSIFEGVEFYEFNNCLAGVSCFSNSFVSCHFFTSPIAVSLAASCVGNKFVSSTFRLTSFADSGSNTVFEACDFEPGQGINYLGLQGKIENCYFELATVGTDPWVVMSDYGTLSHNTLAWSVSTRPDTWLVRVDGKQNTISKNVTSYTDRVILLGANSTGNKVDFDSFHLPVNSGTEEYASYPVQDFGTGNAVSYVSRNGAIVDDYGIFNNTTQCRGNRTYTTYCREPAAHNLSNLTSVASTAIADPFGGKNVYIDTIAGAPNGGFTYTPASYVGDGATMFTTSIYIYIPTGSTVTQLMVFGGDYGVGRYIDASAIPKDKWVRYVQYGQPKLGVNVYPGFLVTGPVGGVVYHSYHTLYEGQNPGTPTGNTVFNQTSDRNISASGVWKTPTFNAGDYTASAGTITVDAADVVTFKYKIYDRGMVVLLSVNSFTLSAGPAVIKVKIPEGKKADGVTYGTGTSFPAASGWEGNACVVNDGSTTIDIYGDHNLGAAAWTMGTDNRSTNIAIEFPIKP